MLWFAFLFWKALNMISIGNLEADDKANIEMLFYAMGYGTDNRTPSWFLLQKQGVDCSMQLKSEDA